MYFPHLAKVTHVFMWNWMQKYKPKKLPNKKKKIDGYIIDEAIVKLALN
jgi:hypothetical protein